MTKAQLKKIMEHNYIFGSEVDDAINFVNEILEFQAKELEENEPYAVNTIRRLRDSAYEVFNLFEYIEDIRKTEEV